jgi:hypothetical protein
VTMNGYCAARVLRTLGPQQTLLELKQDDDVTCLHNERGRAGGHSAT